MAALTAHPCSASLKARPISEAPTPVACCVHVTPPSAVYRMRPPSPATHASPPAAAYTWAKPPTSNSGSSSAVHVVPPSRNARPRRRRSPARDRSTRCVAGPADRPQHPVGRAGDGRERDRRLTVGTDRRPGVAGVVRHVDGARLSQDAAVVRTVERDAHQRVRAQDGVGLGFPGGAAVRGPQHDAAGDVGVAEPVVGLAAPDRPAHAAGGHRDAREVDGRLDRVARPLDAVGTVRDRVAGAGRPVRAALRRDRAEARHAGDVGLRPGRAAVGRAPGGGRVVLFLALQRPGADHAAVLRVGERGAGEHRLGAVPVPVGEDRVAHLQRPRGAAVGGGQDADHPDQPAVVGVDELDVVQRVEGGAHLALPGRAAVGGVQDGAPVPGGPALGDADEADRVQGVVLTGRLVRPGGASVGGVQHVGAAGDRPALVADEARVAHRAAPRQR